MGGIVAKWVVLVTPSFIVLYVFYTFRFKHLPPKGYILGHRFDGAPSAKGLVAMTQGFLALVRQRANARILFLPHALGQMIRPDRMISATEVKGVVLTGNIIEDYPEDARGSSCLTPANAWLWSKEQGYPRSLLTKGRIPRYYYRLFA